MNSVRDKAMLVLKEMGDRAIIFSKSVTRGEVAKLCKLDYQDYSDAEDYLIARKFVSGTMGGETGLTWLTENGLAQYENLMKENDMKAAIPAIGAIIIGSHITGNVQAVGHAESSDIIQGNGRKILEGIEQNLSKIIDEIVINMNSEQEGCYKEIAAHLLAEIKKQKPEQSTIRRLLGSLGLVADVGGTIDLGEKLYERISQAWPLIAHLAFQIHQYIASLPQ